VDWDRVAEPTTEEGWVALPENGWGAIIAAAAGERLVGRRPVDRTDFRTRITARTGRRVRAWTEPRTVDDQASIDEGVDEYLALAGLPGRPAGYAWYLRRPDDRDDAADPVDAISRRMAASPALEPADVLREARIAVRAVLGGE
jgi:hypothetical protein